MQGASFLSAHLGGLGIIFTHVFTPTTSIDSKIFLPDVKTQIREFPSPLLKFSTAVVNFKIQFSGRYYNKNP